MKVIQSINLKIVILLGFIFTVTSSCERGPSEDVDFAAFGNDAAVFIDGFSGGLDYLPFAGSKLNAFTVDDKVFYQGSASMRFDVPNAGDPSGAFAGAIFPTDGGRDLSEYDALTFWAQSSKGAILNEIGFGNSFGENKYLVAVTNLSIGTGWNKYIIPIPDPSKLTNERGLFWYAEGPENGIGYTFWIDELKYEKLGTIAQPRPAIFNGEDRVEDTFIGSQFTINGTQTYNLPSGVNQTVSAAPSYFTFTSTDPDVARVSELGVISILGVGTAEITATLAGVKAQGSLTVESLGVFDTAVIPPTRAVQDVVSIFSDAYNNVTLNAENPYNGFFNGDGQTTEGGLIELGDENIIGYTNLNFVSVNMFTAPDVNASQMTHIHVDINVREIVDAGDALNFQIVNNDGEALFSTGTVSLGNYSPLLESEWVSYDIPLTDFSGLNGTEDVDLIFFVSSTISAIYVDNIYFYKD